MSQTVQSAEPDVQLEAGAAWLAVRNRSIDLRLDLRTGEMLFASGGAKRRLTLSARAFVQGGSGRLLAQNGSALGLWRRIAPDRGTALAVESVHELSGGAYLHCRIAAAADGFVVRVGVRGGSAVVTGLGLAFPAKDGPLVRARSPHALRIAYCGAHSQSPLSRSEVVRIGPATVMRSWWATAWFDANDEGGFVLGYLEARSLAGRFSLAGFAGEACSLVESRLPAADAILWSEPLWVAPAHNVAAALGEYGRRVGDLCQGSVGFAASPWGWGSWSHFSDEVKHAGVLANARVVAQLGAATDSAPLLHVDHGWEEQFCTHRPMPTWRARRKFTPSLPGLGRALRGEGCRLGLWVVPFAINLVGPVSRPWRAALLRTQAGELRPVIGNGCFCLDPTSPAGEAWLRRIFARLTALGASHFKLDFLRVLLALDPDDPFDGLTQPRPFHRAMSRLEAYRHGLGVIRDAVGPRVHLLACGAPLLPSAGLVDSMRIGPDIEVAWVHGRTGIGVCAESARCNFFWHGRVWRNDPDFLVVPREDRLFRYWASSVAFAGGTTLVSADLPKLSRSRLGDLRRFFPALPGQPLLLGLAPRSGGSRICQALTVHGETVWFIAFLNRGATVLEQRLALAELPAAPGGVALAWDVIAGRPLGRVSRAWSLSVGPRDARTICVRMARAHPQVVGTSGHVGMELTELASVAWDARTLVLRLERQPGRPWPERIYFRVPAGFRLARGSEVRMVRGTRTAVLSARGTRSRALEISFLSRYESTRQDGSGPR